MAFKMASSSVWDQVAMSRQWAASSALEAVQGGVAGATGAANSFWDEDFTGFQRAGEGASAIVSGGSGMALAVGFGLGIHHGGKAMVQDWFRKVSGRAPAKYIDDVKHWKGISAARGVNGGRASVLNKINLIGTRGVERTAEAAMAKGSKGVWRYTGNQIEGGRFIRSSRLMGLSGGLLGTAAAIAIPMAASAVFGVAGQLLDEAHMAYQQSKFHTYDTRDFNNRQMYEWNMNKQNQMMTNMMPYEQNMMSMARVYHSR
jgi:hypothetical protein